MLQIQMRILRVFGLSKAEMNSIIENAQAEGSPSLRLQERDGEYLVCVQASAPTQAMADEYCEKWVQKLRTRFGDACYGFEDTTLAQAALDALLKKRRLLVAADEATGRLLGNALRGLQHSEAAFDFGNQTYLNPANARRIAAPEALLKKFPGDMVQAAAGQCGLCRRVYARNSGAGAFCAAVQPHRRGSLCPEPRNLRYGNRQPYSGLGPPPCIGDAPGTFRYYLQAGAGAPAAAGQRRRPAEARFALYAAPQGCPGQTGG